LPKSRTTLPEEILVDYSAIPRFVETGCDWGAGAALALKYFSEVWSCEVSEEKVDYVRDNFPEVRLTHCTSVDFLSDIPKDRDTFFWLDAHSPKCPLVEELKIIFRRLWTRNSVILIDDLDTICGGRGWAEDVAGPMFEVLRLQKGLVLSFHPSALKNHNSLLLVEHD